MFELALLRFGKERLIQVRRPGSLRARIWLRSCRVCFIGLAYVCVIHEVAEGVQTAGRANIENSLYVVHMLKIRTSYRT